MTGQSYRQQKKFKEGCTKMKKYLQNAVAVCMIFLMTTLTTQTVFANVNVNVPTERQQMSNWCWAATTVAVAKFYGKSSVIVNGSALPLTQPNHVHRVTGSPTNNVGRVFSTLRTDFSTCYSIGSTHTFGSLTASASQSQLYANKPVLIAISWSGGGGHGILMTGYLTSGSLYRIMDPGTGTHSYHTYNTIRDAYNTSGTWVETLYNFG